MSVSEILAIIFGATALVGVIGGAVNRFQGRKAIGPWFIQYNAIVLALPAAASLVFLDLQVPAAVSIITGCLAYGFAERVKRRKPPAP